MWSNLASNPTSYLLLFYLFLLPVQLNIFFWPSYAFLSGLRSDLLAPSFYATDIIFIILFVVSLPYFIKLRLKVIIGVLGIGGYFIGVSLLSSSPFLALYGLLRLMQAFYLTFLVVLCLKDPFWRIYLKKTLMVSASLVILLGVLQYSLQHSLGGFFYFLGERTFSSQTPGIANVSIQGNLILRPYATFPHPNVLSGFLAVVFTYITVLTPFSQLKKEKLTILFLVILFFCLLFTFSRTAIVLTTIILIYSLYKKSSLVAGGIILSCVLFLFLSLPGTHFLSSSLSEESSSKRIFLLLAAKEIFLNHPFLGTGLSHFLPSLLAFSPTLPLSFLQPVHSLFILVIVEVGLLGSLVLMGSALYLFTNMRENAFPRLPFMLLFIGLGSMDHYLWTLHQGHLILVLLLAGIFHTTGKSSHVRRTSNRNYPKERKKEKDE